MEIRLYSSNTLNGACGAVIDALGANNAPGSSHIVIAPDKFSLSIEKEIFERLGLDAAFNIDVVSFMRLAIKALGPLASESLSKEGALLVFKKVLNANADKLIHYGKVARMPNFASEMYAVITSFRNNCFAPEDIAAAVDSLSKNTKKKAHDIQLLYKEYIKEMQNGFADGTSRIDSFVAKAASSALVADSHFYIVGFSSFSAKQYQIIAALMRHAKTVSVGITPHNGGANAAYYPYHCKERLQTIADSLGKAATVYESVTHIKEPFGTINRSLFAVSGTKKPASGNKLTLFEENTVFDEINGIAKEIAFIVSRRNLRYKDIAVVCCNDQYTELIRNIFGRYDIPCFVDKKYRLKDALIFKYLAAALDVVEYGFRQDKVRAYIKNPLCGISAEDADDFENYILARCIAYKGFLSPFVGEDSQQAEEVRGKLIKELARFSDKKQTAADFAIACRSLIINTKTEELLLAEAELVGDAVIMASNKQSAAKLATLLDEIKTLIGDEIYSFGECKNIFYSCAEGVELSLIPQYADSVFVGNIKDSRYDNLKAIFVMAATRDVLPAAHSFRAIISAKDSVLMEEAGLRLYPTPQDQMREDMFALLDLFTKADDYMYFGYSKLAPNGARTLPSPVFGELGDITDAKTISLAARYSCATAENKEALAASAASPQNAFFEFLQLSRGASQGSGRISQNLDILYSSLPKEYQEKIIDLMYAPEENHPIDGGSYFSQGEDGKLYTKATQLGAYFLCPRLHHYQLGLKLKPRKDGKLERNNAGIIIHKVLELFFERTKDRLRQMTEKELQKASDKAIAEAFSDPKTIGDSLDVFTKNALRSIKKECARVTLALADKVKKSDYTPKLIEHMFSGDEIIIKTPDGIEFGVRGKIDRADVSSDGRKATIVDYKTGSQGVPSVKDIYFGNCFQLWIYLKALSNLGYQPTGAFYLPITDSPKKDENPYLLSGFFDIAEHGNMDTGFYDSLAGGKLAPETVFVKLDKKNQISSKNALDKATLENYVLYNIEIARLAIAEIISGNADKSPFGVDGCQRCVYYSACGGADTADCRTSAGKVPLDNDAEGDNSANEEADND